MLRILQRRSNFRSAHLVWFSDLTDFISYRTIFFISYLQLFLGGWNTFIGASFHFDPVLVQPVRGWLNDAIAVNIDEIFTLKLGKLSRLALFVGKSRFTEL